MPALATETIANTNFISIFILNMLYRLCVHLYLRCWHRNKQPQHDSARLQTRHMQRTKQERALPCPSQNATSRSTAWPLVA